MAKSTPMLTIKQVMAGFSVSDMTVYTWRQPGGTRDPLPSEKIGNAVGFRASLVKAWAKKYDLGFDLDRALATPVAASGPKPKLKLVPKKPLKAAAKKKSPARARA